MNTADLGFVVREHRRHFPDGFFARLGRGFLREYYRAFLLSQDVAGDKISAELKHGVLTVRLPRAEEAKPRKVAVKAG